jgi:hypothetical protein
MHQQTATSIPTVEVLFKGPLQLLALLTKGQLFVQPVPTNGVCHGWRGVHSIGGLFVPSVQAGQKTQHETSKSSSTNHNTEHADPKAQTTIWIMQIRKHKPQYGTSKSKSTSQNTEDADPTAQNTTRNTQIRKHKPQYGTSKFKGTNQNTEHANPTAQYNIKHENPTD